MRRQEEASSAANAASAAGSTIATAATDTAIELDALRGEYDSQISLLEQQLSSKTEACMDAEAAASEAQQRLDELSLEVEEGREAKSDLLRLIELHSRLKERMRGATEEKQSALVVAANVQKEFSAGGDGAGGEPRSPAGIQKRI